MPRPKSVMISGANSCAAPTITAAPVDSYVAYGGTAVLVAGVSGTPTIQYRWYSGYSGDTSTLVGTTASLTTPSVTGEQRYWLAVSNACGSAKSATVTVRPVLSPTFVTATVVSATQINVAWTYGTNPTSFTIQRKTGTGAWGNPTLIPGTSSSYSSTGLTACTAYAYRVPRW